MILSPVIYGFRLPINLNPCVIIRYSASPSYEQDCIDILYIIDYKTKLLDRCYTP